VKPFFLLPPAFPRFKFSWHDSYAVWVGKQVRLVEIGLDWFSLFLPLLIFLLLKRVELEPRSRKKL